jgi:RNA polymerase sigma factor (sigma-70 family)
VASIDRNRGTPRGDTPERSTPTPSFEEGVTDALFEAARHGEGAARVALHEEIRRLSRALSERTSMLAGVPSLDWEDIAQEATGRVFEVGLAQFRGQGSARGFLYKTVKATMLMAIRASRRREDREAGYVRESEVRSDRETTQTRLDVETVLGRLDAGCRELVAGLFLDGLTVRALARAEGVEESTVRSRLSRCLRRARELTE